MVLREPCMTIHTVCSSAFVGLNKPQRLCKDEIAKAIVGGVSSMLAPGNTATMLQSGVLSRGGSCKSLSADVDGYARAEAINAIFVKPLSAAIRHGNPIRTIIGAQEALIRKAYQTAGISDFSRTATVECYCMGRPVDDAIETTAIARVFGDFGVHITSVKHNLGQGGVASGITSLIKSVLALGYQTIPTNIKFSKRNPNIPFKEHSLTVHVKLTPWPQFKNRSKQKCDHLGLASQGDLLSSVSVSDAVAGHSGGEIVAAYATGALTAKGAIITSWKRGLAAEKQKQAGIMAAIGLSAEKASPLLPANVVVACENSPTSTTTSANGKEVQEIAAHIRESHPNW
ncbi:uncharacterized protein Triagg1_9119 [Trichoderma aggressivum f. europaeum]|uniref:Ketosynthase family 3 (KS3) domain-containing protein n=1 Tax=Trichoderma aggressivum f. europaeum TaxID=173218 RepID=A0AAE1I6Y9_9HYPO|nr:hypothetical protein Triagg1_9119 [Trichoderma aggressivum f. europaeum]